MARLLTDLAAYLRSEAGRRFALGRADCVVFVANWVMLCRGTDPMAYCRGRYDSAEAAELFIVHKGGRGGLLRAVGRVLRQAGLAMTRSPQPGDVAVVALDGTFATCAIRTTRGWAMRLDDGLCSMPPERVRMLAAWSI